MPKTSTSKRSKKKDKRTETFKKFGKTSTKHIRIAQNRPQKEKDSKGEKEEK